ncbi:tyrosine-type recombinase/integrase [Methylovorus mays]|uniref:tyrosine-type recombinase/integrase n=1 Tax=Methylovorus mays TaxID=184077 RepID=UPI001E4D260F|nr:site-specific integrase [Methylovorus mays]MCB5206231.1 site-specific integrase [Methylovorus mays]
MLVLRNGIWQIHLMKPDGSKLRQSSKTADKVLAQKLHDKISTELWEGRWIDRNQSGNMTLDAAFDKVMAQRWEKQRSWFSVIHNYNRFKKYLKGSTKLSEITRARLWEVIGEMREDEYTDGTINRSMAVISTILKTARDDWEVIEKIPKVPLLKVGRGRMRWLKDDEELPFLEWFRKQGDHDMVDLIEVLLETGCRVSEILRLKDTDVHINERRLYLGITKSGEEEYQPLSEYALQIFLRRYKIGVPPFEGVSRWGALSRFQTAKRHLGYADDHELVLHTMRHTCASRLVQSGVDLKRVQEYMRHKDINTTLIYAKLSSEENAKTASVFDKRRSGNRK